MTHSSSAAGWGAISSTKPGWMPFAGGWKVRQAVSSAPHSPTEAGARRNTHRVAGPVRPQLAKATPAVSSVAAGCCETDPTGVATARLVRE
jgi:hypothetical protein